MLASRQNSTVCKYKKAFDRWDIWCQNNALLPALPAKPLHVALYFVHLSKAGSYSAVEAAYYGISWAHKVADLLDPTSSSLPNLVKEGLKRKLGKPSRKREPAPVSMVQGLGETYRQSQSLCDLRLATFSALAFSGFLRFNDLISLKLKDFRVETDHLVITVPGS